MKMLIGIVTLALSLNHMYALNVNKNVLHKPLWSELPEEKQKHSMKLIDAFAAGYAPNQKVCQEAGIGLMCLKDDSVTRPTVLFIGSSVDKKMVRYCWDQNVCKDGKNTSFEYIFIPGISPPYMYVAQTEPTWTEWHSNSSYGVIKKAARKFKRAPSLVIVSSDLWDLAAWWQQAGKPKKPYHYTTHFDRWIDSDIPELLQYVQEQFPESKIMYRTAPVTGGDTNYGASPELMEKMYELTQSKMIDGKFLGKYDVFDYHAVIDKMVEEKGTKEVFFAKRFKGIDPIHPNDMASEIYMRSIFKMVH